MLPQKPLCRRCPRERCGGLQVLLPVRVRHRDVARGACRTAWGCPWSPGCWRGDDAGRDQADRRVGEVPEQRGEPARLRQHVGVEEGDQRGRRGGEAGVARGRGPRDRSWRRTTASPKAAPWAAGSAEPSSTTITPPRPDGSAASRRATAGVRSLTGITTVTSAGPGPPWARRIGCAIPASSSRRPKAAEVASVIVKRPVASNVRPGRGQAEQARRSPAEERGAAVERDDVAVEDERRAGRRGAVGWRSTPLGGRSPARHLRHAAACATPGS